LASFENYDVAKEGKRQFLWAKDHMPALYLATEYVRNLSGPRLLSGLRIGICLHISKETAVLIESLHSFGMKIDLVAANPLSTQNPIGEFLERHLKVNVRGRKFESVRNYRKDIMELARTDPDLIVDDGGELHVAYSRSKGNRCFGGTDETTSGTTRLLALKRERRLKYTAIPVNEARTKYFFDNKYGTGQSSIDGLMRATGLLIAGKVLVVSGYGWVGKGVAERARGLGARVIVTEVDPLAALDAHLDGFEVIRIDEAVRIGEIFLTCTGQIDVLSSEHFQQMKNGAILGNCGHFDKEISVSGLRGLSLTTKKINEYVTEFRLPKKSIFLLCEGRVINLVAAEGHPPEVMQLSFANQLLAIHYLASHVDEFAGKTPEVLPFPRELDEMVSKFALRAFNLRIDILSPAQQQYSQSYSR
jgi:adenosylhomocysteinase